MSQLTSMSQGVWPLLAAAIGVAVIGGGWILRRRFVVVTVHGVSMQPTYRPGDRVLVRRRTIDGIRAGDVVIVELSGLDLGNKSASGSAGPRLRNWVIKRVAAAPGDPVPVAYRAAVPRLECSVVPAHRLLVVGDNSAHSLDSRTTGYVPAAGVLGVVVRMIRRR